MTRNTIEMHLGHVYRKLEVAGREQLPDALLAGEPEPDAEPVANRDGSG